MSADAFEILMVVALGALAGTGIGLLVVFAAKKQKSEWSAMSVEGTHPHHCPDHGFLQYLHNRTGVLYPHVTKFFGLSDLFLHEWRFLPCGKPGYGEVNRVQKQKD